MHTRRHWKFGKPFGSERMFPWPSHRVRSRAHRPGGPVRRYAMEAGAVAALVSLIVWVRRLRRPWEVAQVGAERSATTTITSRPVGHEGFRFEPGRFGWITVGRSPFALIRHPFSFSSIAAADDSVQMSIKTLGDFTESAFIRPSPPTAHWELCSITTRSPAWSRHHTSSTCQRRLPHGARAGWTSADDRDTAKFRTTHA